MLARISARVGARGAIGAFGLTGKVTVALEEARAVEESDAEPVAAGTPKLFVLDTAELPVAATTIEAETLAVVVVVSCEYAGALRVRTLDENGASVGCARDAGASEASQSLMRGILGCKE